MRTTYKHTSTKDNEELQSNEIKIYGVAHLDHNSSMEFIAEQVRLQQYNIGEISQANLQCYSSPRDVNSQLREVERNLDMIIQNLIQRD